MASSRQRRKRRRRKAINADVKQVVPPSDDDESALSGMEVVNLIVEEAEDAPDAPVPDREEGSTSDGESAFSKVAAAKLIAAIGPLRHSRRQYPLVAGIRMFSAMLDEAKGGYIADYLAELENALGVVFDASERDGIVGIASAITDDFGVPNVEEGVQMCLEARQAAVGTEEEVEEEEVSGQYGVIGVDSGTVLICDPAHIASGNLKIDPDHPTLEPGQAVRQLYSEAGVPIAVAALSGVGDGTYPVVLELAEDGSTIEAIAVEFLPGSGEEPPGWHGEDPEGDPGPEEEPVPATEDEFEHDAPGADE